MKSMNLFNDVGVKSSEALFGDNKSSKTSFVDNKTKDITGVEDMFIGCESLTQLDPLRSKAEDMTNVDMEDMFIGCESLTQPNPSRSKAEDMTGMKDIFSDCKSLT